MDHILVLGYYNRKNLGDEAYKLALPQLFPKYKLNFHNIEDTNITFSYYKSIIIGGGDLFNNYFLSKLLIKLQSITIPVIGFSLGLPYTSCITPSNVTLFDRIFTRNKQELELLQLLMGSDRVHYLPDATFIFNNPKPYIESALNHLLSRGIFIHKPIITKPKKTCGVFLAQSMKNFPNLINSIIQLLSNINMEINFYIFDTSGKDIQDDHDISKMISTRLGGNHKIVDIADPLKMLDAMKDLTIAICSRFHAHIFCTILGIPFISIATTPKVQKYLEQEGLLDLAIPTNDNGFEVGAAVMKFKDLIVNNTIHDRLITISQQNKFLLTSEQAQILLEKTTKNDYQIPNFLQLDENKIFSQLKPDDDPEQLAQKISYLICKNPQSDYVYGTIENIKQKGFNAVPQMIKWTIDDYRKNQISKIRINIDYINQNIGLDFHRSGWNCVVDNLRTISRNTGLIVDLYLDKSFAWSKDFYAKEGMIPYTAPWMGFVHHTYDTTFSSNNNVEVWKSPEFQRSLPTCRAIFTLSENLKQWWDTKLNGSVPVFALTHPTSFDGIPFKPKWSGDYKLIHIGAWYRNPITFYRLKTSGMDKIMLKGKDMQNYFPSKNMIITKAMLNGIFESSTTNSNELVNNATFLGDNFISRTIGEINTFLKYLIRHILDLLSPIELAHLKSIDDDIVLDFSRDKYDNRIQHMLLKYVNKIISSVIIVDRVSNNEYDNLLSKNIVFIDLVSASASNTLIECVVRNTPIIIPKLPAVVEVLGENYPLYYNGEEDISKLLEQKMIEKTYKYLKKLDKTPFRIEIFISNFSKCIDSL